nr:MAG TPA: hypothetical protein [Caudoviricetes sp.]
MLIYEHSSVCLNNSVFLYIGFRKTIISQNRGKRNY